MEITPLPSMSRTSPTFKSDVNTFFASLLPAFAAESNGLRAELLQLAAQILATSATTVALRYNFSTTTTNADPGTGVIRLNNATQNAATELYIDDYDSTGSGFPANLDDVFSLIAGYRTELRIVSAADVTKYLSYRVLSTAHPSGYRVLTLAKVGSSVNSPFADGEPVVLTFVRMGAVAPHFTSAEQTITSSGALTLAHGLGAAPTFMQGFLKCQNVSAGYAVGDVVAANLAGSSTVSQGFSMTADATNIYIRFGTATQVFMINSKNTGGSFNLANSDWKFIVKAVA